MSQLHRFERRRFLRGAGVSLGLPLLDAFAPKRAAAAVAPGYAVFVVGMNGVQQAGGYGDEPERFWPSNTGALSRANMAADSGRAVSELVNHAEHLNIIKGLSFAFSNNGCGHSGGGNQVLTAAKVSPDLAKNKSLAMGPSVDYRIARALTNQDPLALYAGPKHGYINDHISHRGAKDVIVAENNPWTTYARIVAMTGGSKAASELLMARRKSVNDLLRKEIAVLLADPQLSSADRKRIEQHLSSVRDIEFRLRSELPPETMAELKDMDGKHRVDGNRLKIMDLQYDLLAMALSSGLARVGFLQVGDGTDGIGHIVNGARTTSFHHISHRINSDGGEGTSISNADMLHHKIDRIVLGSFAKLLDKLQAVQTPTGSLLDMGFAVWTNQLATGSHRYKNVPYIVAGRAGGYLKTGQFVQVPDKTMNNKLLNTLITAAGVRTQAGGPVEDFGDPSLPKGLLTEIVA